MGLYPWSEHATRVEGPFQERPVAPLARCRAKGPATPRTVIANPESTPRLAPLRLAPPVGLEPTTRGLGNGSGRFHPSPAFADMPHYLLKHSQRSPPFRGVWPGVVVAL